ncbi:MAG: transcriptional regulator NrdR [Legionellales bacterium]|nr:MAG: transcriptional regulator NrdR [Legionellales bacterium]
MKCPFCSAEDSKVVDSRLVSEGMQVRRRRECIGCRERFTSYETVELSLPRVLKQDGTGVPFVVAKLRAGILRALEKRPVTMEQVDKSINNIIYKARSSGEREIATSVLGELVMQELRSLDEVAYVRFASVYRKFQDVDEFHAEITRLKNKDAE